MKQCLNCTSLYNSELNQCNVCKASVTFINGFQAFAPLLAKEGGGFKVSYFQELAELEQNNFWFKARNKIILWALKKYKPNFNSYLEIGCGTGFVLSGISQTFPKAVLKGSEIFTDGLKFAAIRLPHVKLMQMDARQIPFVTEFDILGAFDVLEHIKEDTAVIDEVYKALKPGGIFILSVPQHQWLWSKTDELAFHQRRYSNSELIKKLQATGFTILRSTSFVSTLLPAMVLSRTLNKANNSDFDPKDEFLIHPLLNYIFEKMLLLELALIKIGFNFPLGGSRLVVAQKE
jgi:SAM-dependent methyltransferase